MVCLKRFKRQLHRGDGMAVVEMAIVLPFLLLLTFGMIEYGWLFLRSQEITNAARQGARIGAMPDAGNADVNAAVLTAMTNADLDGSGYSVNISPGTDGLATGTEFTVTVTVPYANIVLLNLPFIPTPATLDGITTMNKEGP